MYENKIKYTEDDESNEYQKLLIISWKILQNDSLGKMYS